VSSGEEEPLVLAKKQESPKTPSSTPGDPKLALWPRGAVWLSTVAPSPSSTVVGSAGAVHTEVASASPTPRKRTRFKGLNGRHFQRQEPEPRLQAELQTGVPTPPPTPEAAGKHVEPPTATEASGSGHSRSPWAVLTNEVDVPGAGECRSRAGGSGDQKGRHGCPQVGEDSVSPSWVPLPILKSPLFRRLGTEELHSSCEDNYKMILLFEEGWDRGVTRKHWDLNSEPHVH
jgi:hypothetical protein